VDVNGYEKYKMAEARFITAIGTPLTDNEGLFVEGLAAELADQWAHGVSGILVAGSMGGMQLLTDETYRQLVSRSVELSTGRGEILVGAGDAGYARTAQRIEFLNQFEIDGVAVISPFFWEFNQVELIDYYVSVAEVSRAPIYLYDLPAISGVELTIDTVVELAKHPNIHGIKVSRELKHSRQLIDALDESFRVIVALPELVDMAVRHGIMEHLDGIWAIAPLWTVGIGRCARQGQWPAAAEHQRSINELRRTLVRYGFGAFTTMMNARGIPGRFTPRPYEAPQGERREQLLAEPVVQRLLAEDPAMNG